MSTEISPFHYNGFQVRVINLAGEPWFVLADLAKVLEISDVSRLNSRLDDGVRQTHPILDSLGRTQRATIVSEAGMYEVVIRSDKPEAAAFRRWVTHEVLPAIRRTGGYQLARPELPQSYAEALRAFADEVEARQLAEVRVAALEPSAAAWDAMADAAGDFSVAEAAQQLARAGHEIGRQRLFEWLAAHRWTYRVAGRRPHWLPKQDKVDAGLLALKTSGTFLNERTGETEVAPPAVRVTPAGLRRLNRDLADERLDGVA